MLIQYAYPALRLLGSEPPPANTNLLMGQNLLNPNTHNTREPGKQCLFFYHGNLKKMEQRGAGPGWGFWWFLMTDLDPKTDGLWAGLSGKEGWHGWSQESRSDDKLAGWRWLVRVFKVDSIMKIDYEDLTAPPWQQRTCRQPIWEKDIYKKYVQCSVLL